MASFIWNNSQTNRLGTDRDNWTPQSPVGGPEAGDDIIYDGTETGATPLTGDQLPTSMPSVALGTIAITAAYTLSAAVAGDFTDFCGGNAACTWLDLIISGVTLQTPGTPTIVAGGTLAAVTGVLDTANPLATGGDCDIDWTTLDILGGINATNTITHTSGASGSLDCDVTGTLNLGSVTDTGIVLIFSAGTTTFGDDVLVGDSTQSGGTVDTNGHTLVCSGDVLRTSGTITEINLRTTGTGTLTGYTPTIPLSSFVCETGAITTLVGDGGANMTTIRGTLEGDGNMFSIGNPPVAGWWGVQTGIFNASLIIRNTNNAPGNDVTVASGNAVVIETTSTRAITFDANLDFTGSTVHIQGTGAGDSMTVNMDKYSLKCGAMTVGDDGATTGKGIFNAGSGAHEIASVSSGNVANVGTIFNLDSSTLSLSGVFEADNGANDIICTNTTGVIVGGIVQNAVFDNNVNHLVVAAVDSGNTNVTEIIGTPGTWAPNSRSMQVRNYDEDVNLRSW